MEDRSILLLEFEGAGQVGTALRQILESCPDPDFELTCYAGENYHGKDTELSRLILRQKPLLILLVLSRVQLKSLELQGDVRIIAASNANLEAGVEADRLRRALLSLERGSDRVAVLARAIYRHDAAGPSFFGHLCGEVKQSRSRFFSGGGAQVLLGSASSRTMNSLIAAEHAVQSAAALLDYRIIDLFFPPLH